MKEQEPPVLVIGEALADILTDAEGRRQVHPGGSPANVALGLARLGHPVRLATRVGRDEYGRLLRDHLGRSGVQLAEGSVVDGGTSTATAVLTADGVASYEFDLEWALPQRSLAQWSAPDGIAHLHTGSLATSLAPGAAQVFAAVRSARGATTISYDPNLRPALLGPPDWERPGVEALVAASDLVKASAEDLAWLCPDEDARTVAARWAQAGPALVVLTLGEHGALAFWRRGSCAVPPEPTRVVDTVGAGDSFMAALLSGLIRAGLLGGTTARARLWAAGGEADADPGVVAALSLAARAAAITCARPGADPPTGAELAAFAGTARVTGRGAPG
ncbi:carbohydrate kinase [Streptacidiphilus sp. EB129]|uniref:carbohydrate kinase family protein n=1 Tax=Streptacidiphilus sp. EB129 TaxID=3156262 RepID=UPI0035141B65